MEIDPDYNYNISEDNFEDDQARKLQENAREVVKQKIKNIIKKQFVEESAAKGREVTLITEKLTEARHLLDRLRACVVASYYASSFAKPTEKHLLEPGAAQHPSIQNVLRKAATSVLSRNAPPSNIVQEKRVSNSTTDPENAAKLESQEGTDIDGVSLINDSDVQDETAVIKSPKSASAKENLGGRHRIKKTVIVGNVSKYIAPDNREGNDKSTHKWMVYVRGSANEPRIDHFVRKVWFFLHPSYRPNDLVEVSEAPFHLTRRGWGEFPIRVQLHFCDPRNRRVDIIHNLRLDRTYTGLQTLGAETVCEVELDRSTVGLPIENLLNQSVPIQSANNALETKDANDNNSTISDSTQEEPTADAVVRDVLQDLLVTIEKVVAKGSSSCEEMSVDDDEDEKDLSSSSTTEKRRRRRRGNSCTATENEDNKHHKHAAMTLVCSDDELDVVNVGNEEKRDAPVESNSTVRITDSDSTSAAQSSAVEEANDTARSQQDVKTQSDSCPIADSSDSTEDPSSATSANAASSESKNRVSSPSKRPRSLSADSVVPTVSLSVNLGKPIQVPLLDNGTNGAEVTSSKVTSSQSTSSVVVLRSRSSSTGMPQKYSQTTKGKVTILTPISSKPSPSPTVAGQKRSIGLLSKSSSGKLVLNVVPEKQRKMTESLGDDAATVSNTNWKTSGNPHDRTKQSGKALLTFAPNQSQSAQTPAVKDIRLRLGSSGSAVTGSKGKGDSDVTKGPKSFLLKNTKQGLVVIGQSVVCSKSTASQASNQNSATTQKVESARLKVEATQTKQIPPLPALQALKCSVVNHGVAGNRPIQLKVEKSNGKPPSSHLKHNQQYILTSLTNEQGKQQLALVSADRLKQAGTSKQNENLPVNAVASESHTSELISFETLERPTTSALIKRLSNHDNLPYCKVVADKLLSTIKTFDLVRDVLPAAVKYVPLVANECSVAYLPFCAKSEAEFLDWNVGKQRAAEMQRATLIRKILQHVRDKCEALSGAELPNKRFIIDWCLMRGYSVFTDEFESDDTDMETDDRNSPKQLQPSITSGDHLVKSLLENQKSIPIANTIDNDVDVLSVTTVRRTVKEEPLTCKETKALKCRYIYSKEMKAVDKIAQKIGIKLKAVETDDASEVPVCHAVLAKALELFTMHLTRETLASALMRRDAERRIQRVLPERLECRDVADAIRRENDLQVFSDAHMGIDNDSCYTLVPSSSMPTAV